MELNIKPLQDSHEVEVQVTFRLPRGGAGDQASSFGQNEAAPAKQLDETGSGTTKHLLGDYDSEGGALASAQGIKRTSKGCVKRIVEKPLAVRCPSSAMCIKPVRAAARACPWPSVRGSSAVPRRAWAYSRAS